MKATTNKKGTTAGKTPAKKAALGKFTGVRKLGALAGKIHLAPDAFTPAEMSPYLQAKRRGKKG